MPNKKAVNILVTVYLVILAKIIIQLIKKVNAIAPFNNKYSIMTILHLDQEDDQAKRLQKSN